MRFGICKIKWTVGICKVRFTITDKGRMGCTDGRGLLEYIFGDYIKAPICAFFEYIFAPFLSDPCVHGVRTVVPGFSK